MFLLELPICLNAIIFFEKSAMELFALSEPGSLLIRYTSEGTKGVFTVVKNDEKDDKKLPSLLKSQHSYTQEFKDNNTCISGFTGVVSSQSLDDLLGTFCEIPVKRAPLRWRLIFGTYKTQLEKIRAELADQEDTSTDTDTDDDTETYPNEKQKEK